MQKILVRTLGGVFALFLTLLVAGAWYFSSLLRQAGPHECRDDHYVFCTDPSEVGLKFENVKFESRDGLQLAGWYIPGKTDAPAVLMVHGRNATRREALRYAPSLQKAGFNLLLIDLRNCGESEKSFISMGYYEQLDALAGVDYLIQQKGMTSVGIFGFSMGGVTSILAMADDPRIKAGVFEASFDSLTRILADRAGIDYGLPEWPLVPLVELFYGWRGDFDTDAIRPVDRIDDIAPRPVFIIHGTADKTVPYHHGESLFAAAKEPKQFWTVPDGQHTRAWNANKEKAETDIPAFFTRYL